MKESVESKWYLRGTLPHIPLGETADRDLDTYFVTDAIEATVPGGVHMDLFNAGLIENPYYEKNSLKCEWVEHRWWYYETELCLSSGYNKKYLVFEGLDYECDIFINDVKVGKHSNMFTQERIDISSYSEEKLNLKVLFKGIPQELGQYGKTSETTTQKSRFGYGWDFATRLVNIGIWQDVYVEYVRNARLDEARIYTDYKDGKGIIDAQLFFEGESRENITACVISPEGEKILEKEVPFDEKTSVSFEVETPQLWYPNGMGEHPLYTLRILCDGDVYEYKTGIRRLRYLQNPGSDENSIPYTIEINGKSVYIRGVNKVPFDHLYGNVTSDTYKWYVNAMVNQNVNLVRVWGGGIIEKEEFYNLCDENGIMIWQDFIQSSSGIENVPSKKDVFLEKLTESATAAVKVKRNHTALTIWTGGNELTDENNKPVSYKDKNIALLKSIVDKEDPQRLFLPSTPSGPVYRLEFDNPNNHDVHSPWEYYPDHYENYNKLRLLLHSEFGVSGPSASTALFLKKNVSGAPNWNSNYHHAEYWYHSQKRDVEYFGKFETTDEYVPYGQWIQAEGLRYAIETERRLAPYASGSMVWQVNEPWPNSDNTCLMDYFGNPKMAYYWIKKAFSDCNVSLRFERNSWKKEFWAEVCIQGDMSVTDEEFKVAIYNSDGKCLKEYAMNCKNLPCKIEGEFEDKNEIYLIRISHRGIDKEYYFSSDTECVYRPARCLGKTQISYSMSDFNECEGVIKCSAALKNNGNNPAYFVYPKDKNLNYAILADDAYFTLLPGEERTVNLTVRKRLGLFFEKVNTEPEIIFDYLNR